MTFKATEIALNSRLAVLPGGIDIFWEGVEYRPQLTKEHLRPTLLGFNNEVACLSDGKQINEGIYRVDVIFPAGFGTGQLLSMIDTIYDHFKSELRLEVDTTKVWIRTINPQARIITEGAWIMSSIDINFAAYDSL